jgi:TolB protein
MDIDGANPTNLTNNTAEDFNPAPSNSGDVIAFVSSRDGDLDVFLMGANGSSPLNLTNNATEDAYPSWSFDDGWLSFATLAGNKEIFAVRRDGSLFVNVTNNPAGDDYPTWR